MILKKDTIPNPAPPTNVLEELDIELAIEQRVDLSQWPLKVLQQKKKQLIKKQHFFNRPKYKTKTFLNQLTGQL